jgi:hypothetical protein
MGDNHDQEEMEQPTLIIPLTPIFAQQKIKPNNYP